MTVDVPMLDTYLGLNGSINTDRAELLLSLATDLCLSVVNPLPTGSDGVVLDVAARSYTNPTNAQSSVPGPYPPTPSLGGLWLTKTNVATLRRLSTTSSGAFTVDPTPTDAGPYNYWYQMPETMEDALANVNAPWSDWDVPPNA